MPILRQFNKLILQQTQMEQEQQDSILFLKKQQKLFLKTTQYNSLNVLLSNLRLKSAIKNETEVVLRLSSNVISDNESNFHHKLLLTNRQVSNLRRTFASYLSEDIKLSKTQLSKMIQSGGFLGRLLGPLVKTG